MKEHLFKKICAEYNWNDNTCYEPLGSGLINSTWKVTTENNIYVLQAINHHVFKNPEYIDENIKLVTDFLSKKNPEYLFPTLLKTNTGNSFIKLEGEWFRVLSFIKNTQTFTTVNNELQAFEAAKQFGNFTALLNELNCNALHIVLPDFHNLSLRYEQFNDALKTGNNIRIIECKDAIAFLQSQKNIVEEWRKFITHKEAEQRVTHHDTKISNVLFNECNEGACVIDLDTIMPGYFISDVGDMFRTYISPVSEEETDFNKITIRKNIITAIYNGYMQPMKNLLSVFEQDHFYFSGEFMIYMQALRFLTDYLNNDIYYGCKYEKHNYNRAINQITLLQQFQQTV
ncbi:MAG: aminoglycoside phosphotransferase family protein [Bacteroidetes bacterium]|nr:aminoglycoside phosphotransferase family protein [Bacteroidota bacterium]MBS1649641.1 aminoglycoside phosphotransferase family protein [Bacteroidota bacterium]